ncbi:MAG: hypothetical protein P4M11_04430 [Candidatus Pacebacteria bacterium]|nr:hypothetical protein [Candidatus Paceibacterota bacterium]
MSVNMLQRPAADCKSRAQFPDPPHPLPKALASSQCSAQCKATSPTFSAGANPRLIFTRTTSSWTNFIESRAPTIPTPCVAGLMKHRDPQATGHMNETDSAPTCNLTLPEDSDSDHDSSMDEDPNDFEEHVRAVPTVFLRIERVSHSR